MDRLDTFGKNISLLENRFKEFIDLRVSEKNEDFHIKKSEAGFYNLLLKDHKNQFYPVYNEVDPLKESGPLLSEIRTCKGNIICILGLGLCHLIRSVVEAAGDDNTIVFFESNPAVFKKAMELENFEDVLAKENIRFVVGKIPDLYKLLSTEKDKLYISIGIKVIEVNTVTSADKSWYETIKKKIENFGIKKKDELKTVAGAGRFFFKNRFENLLIMAESKPLESLRGVYKNKSAILVAAGPSLAKNIDHLTTVKKRALIIAVDSAVVPLVNKGIIPDYIVTADFRDFTYEKLAQLSHVISDSCLIMLSEASRKIPGYIKFKEIYYATQNDITIKMIDDLLEDSTTALTDVASGFHLALSSAQIFGCSLIVFTGLDLGFSGTQDHVEGTVLSWGDNIKEDSTSLYVEGVDGKPVHTLPGFIAMKEVCERILFSAPELRYIDATEGGAKVEGTEIHQLVNVVNGLDENETIQPIKHIKNKADYSLLLTRLEALKKKLLSLNKQIKQYDSHKKNIQKYFKNPNNFIVLSAKLENSIRKMDMITTQLNDDEAMGYAKELLTEYYEDYFQHERKKLGQGTTKENSVVVNLNQQIFVHKIRKKGLGAFLDIVNRQIKLFNGLKKLEEGEESNSKESLLKLGEYYYQNEFISRAEDIFVEIDGLSESDFYLGCINIKKGQIEKGKSYFERAVSKQGTLKEKIDAFITSTVHSLLTDNIENNVATKLVMEKILKLDPDNLKAYAFLQNIYLNQVRALIINNKLNDAEIKLSSYCNPEIEFRHSFMSLSLLTLLYFQSGKYEYIHRLLSTALELQKNKKEFCISCFRWINLFECLRKGWLMEDNQVEQLGLWFVTETEDTGYGQMGEDILGNSEAVIKNLSCLSELLTDWTLVNVETCLENNKGDKALRILDSSFEKNRSNLPFLKLYVLQLFIVGRVDEAIGVFNELTSIAPHEISLLKEVGDNYAAVDDYDSALTIYEECLVLMPENHEVLYSIGEVYYETGNRDSAGLALTTLLAKQPDHILAKNLYDKIKI